MRNTGRHHGGELTAEHGDVAGDDLAAGSKGVAWRLDARGATPWRRRSARTAASLAASDLPRTLLPRLSLPSQTNWVSFCLRLPISPWLNPSGYLLIDGDAVDFFQAGDAVFHFLQSRAAQIPDAVFGRPGRRSRWRRRPP